MNRNLTDYGISNQGHRHRSVCKRSQGAADARKRSVRYTSVCEQANDKADAVPCDRLHRNSFIRLSVAFIVLFVLVSVANGFAEGIKTRMQARLPVIVALKAEGIIGENYKGYLGFVGSARKKADIVTAENQDRRQVYAAIAKQQGTTVELVGELRARQIAGNASPGDWLQNEQGAWIQK